MKSCLYQERQTENNWGAKDKTSDQHGSSSPNLLSRKVNRNCDKKHYHIPDSKLVYRWPGACQMRCTWWWGRTCRPPDRAGPWPVWSTVSRDIKLKSTNWRRNHLHIETDSSERGQCSQSASMAVRGMVRAARRSDTAKLIIRMFLQDWENKQVEPALKVVDGKLLWEDRTEHIILDHLKLITESFCHNSILIQ